MDATDREYLKWYVERIKADGGSLGMLDEQETEHLRSIIAKHLIEDKV